MASFEDWWADEPLRPPAEYALDLAAARTLRPSDQLFLATDRDVEEHAAFLDVERELAHALVLALRDRPQARRRQFAAAFYAARDRSKRRDPLDWEAPQRRPALAVASTAAARVVDLAEPPALRAERVVDLLTGAAQGDDLTALPEPAAAELGRVLSAAVSELASSDPLEPGAAAGQAVVEVLAPASGEVGLQEVLLRATWAALGSWDEAAVLALLVEIDAAYVPE